MAKNFKRRNYFIDKSFQSKFIFKFALIVVISAALMTVATLYFSQDSNTVAIENTRVVVKKTSDFILPILAVTVISSFVFCVIAVALLSMIVSHKISGPLFRLQREIEEMKKGDLRRNFQIRGNDQLQVLAKSLDQMCNSLNTRQLEIKRSFTSLERFLQAHNYCLDKNDAEQVVTILNKMQANLDEFKC